MNTNMNKQYFEMHTVLLNICNDNDIRLILGKRASCEILYRQEAKGIKAFFLLPADMEKFSTLCIDKLQDKGYTTEKKKTKNGTVCRIYMKDMLATTINSLMNNLGAHHCPQIVIRELIPVDDDYKFTSDGKVFSFKQTELSDLEKKVYMSGFIYAKKNIIEHVETFYGKGSISKSSLLGYGVFSENCLPKDFIEEAKKRGYLSEERVSRFKEYRTWKKDKRDPIEEKYRKYQEDILGFKLPY